MKLTTAILGMFLLLFSGCKKGCEIEQACFNLGKWDNLNCKCNCQPNYSGPNCENYTPACQVENYGSIRIKNYQDDPYEVYRDGSFYTYIGAYGEFVNDKYTGQCNSWKFKQASGYILYPSEYTAYQCVSACGLTFISF